MRDAVISACGQYRYTLTRDWGPGSRATFIMLNPSTADALLDDPTIRRCKTFARDWGCDGLVVVNLYAWRATSPDELKVPGRDIVGPENDAAIADAVTLAADNGWPVVAAWGTKARPGRAARIVRSFEALGATLECLGTTKDGHPRHPLYVRADAPLVAYPGQA